jgi:hypothetical protein
MEGACRIHREVGNVNKILIQKVNKIKHFAEVFAYGNLTLINGNMIYVCGQDFFGLKMFGFQKYGFSLQRHIPKLSSMPHQLLQPSNLTLVCSVACDANN